MSPRGRRPGGGDTRSAIVAAARAQFAAHGYDQTSLRGIARAAGVDPALVHHYFAGKAAVFAETMALPDLDPAEVIARVADGPAETLGERAVRTFLGVWDGPATRPVFVAMARSAATNDLVARAFREFLAREIFGRIAARYAVPDPDLRGALAASQIYGLGVARYVLKFPAVVAADRETLVRLVGPVLQGYLAPPDA